MAENGNGLEWLKDATPSKTEFVAAKRGRQPGDNPVEGHVVKSHENGETLTLSVPAEAAKKVERLLRRAATRHGWGMAVQVLTADPANGASQEDVVALKDVAALDAGTDVWISFKATEPKPRTAKADTDTDESTETGSENGDADPFQGQPTGDGSGETPDAETGTKRRGKK